ncbi:MAG: hypothetical protein V3S22_03750 [Candidatus Neomarinimicrobiota bacterium]
MKYYYSVISLIILTGLLEGQQPYLSVDQIQEEWQDYTDFQKQELVSFSNFLMDEGFYERALLGYFRFLYKFPHDSLKYSAYFQIAKAYELMGKLELSLKYYQRIVDEAPPSTLAAKASDRQIIYLLYIRGDLTEVFERTAHSEDPYYLIFRGYAYMQELKWTEARISFKAAEVLFDHSHYSKLLRPLYKALNAAENAPLKKRMPALLSALAPGGGHLYLKQYENALGSAFSSILLYSAIFSFTAIEQGNSLNFQDNRQRLIPVANKLNSTDGSVNSSEYQIPDRLKLKSSRKKILVIPVTIALGLYVGSIWKTVNDIDSANHRLVERFVGRVSDRYPIDRFLDYRTPEFYLK